MKKYAINKRTYSLLLIVFIVFLLLVDIASVGAAYYSDHVTTKSFFENHDFPIIKKIITEFIELLKNKFDTPQNTTTIDNQTYYFIPGGTIEVVVIGNTTKTVDMLSEDEEVVQLYNLRLGIKSPGLNFTVLPEDSKVLSEDEVNTTLKNVTFIDIPGSESVIGLTAPIIQVPLDDMVRNVTRHQFIKSLNRYEVSALFSELNNSALFENIVCYTIDWGDGTPAETFLPNQTTVTHLYRSSGTYLQILYITDISGETYSFTNYYDVEYEGHLLRAYFILDEYKEPIATTSVGMGTVALLGFALTETGKYKLLPLLTFLIPLYTRIEKDDALDHFVRGEIYGLIKANPGICYNAIMKTLGIKNGTLSYHLHKLEKMELIKSRREGLRYRAFYSQDVAFPQEERYRLTELQVDILKIIRSSGGITQRDIAKKLQKKPQTISYNIKVLRQSDLIRLRRMGRRTICYAL